MATEIYQPPQEMPPTTKVYSLPTESTGTVVYEDPNDILFLGDIQFVGREPTLLFPIDCVTGALGLNSAAPVVA
jgi:hypothetical protein